MNSSLIQTQIEIGFHNLMLLVLVVKSQDSDTLQSLWFNAMKYLAFIEVLFEAS